MLFRAYVTLARPSFQQLRKHYIPFYAQVICATNDQTYIFLGA